ncbi:allantoate amidohydrolase [Microbacterium sp. HM58-2]|nr:allantoate amidohydrolase [Microbacterium sp. HM58-2]
MRRPHVLAGAALAAALVSGCSSHTTDVAVETPAHIEPSASAAPVDGSSVDGADFTQLCVPGQELVDAYPPEWTENEVPALPFEVSELCHADGGQRVYGFTMGDEARYDRFAVVAEEWMDALVSAGFVVNSVQGGFGDYESDSEPVSKYFAIRFVGSDPNLIAQVRGAYDEQITLSIHIDPQ